MRRCSHTDPITNALLALESLFLQMGYIVHDDENGDTPRAMTLADVEAEARASEDAQLAVVLGWLPRTLLDDVVPCLLVDEHRVEALEQYFALRLAATAAVEKEECPRSTLDAAMLANSRPIVTVLLEHCRHAARTLERHMIDILSHHHEQRHFIDALFDAGASPPLTLRVRCSSAQKERRWMLRVTDVGDDRLGEGVSISGLCLARILRSYVRDNGWYIDVFMTLHQRALVLTSGCDPCLRAVANAHDDDDDDDDDDSIPYTRIQMAEVYIDELYPREELLTTDVLRAGCDDKELEEAMRYFQDEPIRV